MIFKKAISARRKSSLDAAAFSVFQAVDECGLSYCVKRSILTMRVLHMQPLAVSMPRIFRTQVKTFRDISRSSAT